MKKSILLFSIGLLISCASFAQEGFHLGVQYGYYLVGMTHNPNTNAIAGNTDNNPMTQFKPKYSSAFGVAAGYGFIPMLSVQAELNFQTTGQSAKGTWGGGAPVSRDIDLKYIQLPVMIKFRTPGLVLHYFLMAGPQFNFLSSASITDTRGANFSKSDAKAYYTSTDAGIAFATGLDIDVPKVYFNIGLKFYYGLGDPNVTAWQIPASVGAAYQGLHNFYGGLCIGAHFKF